MGRWRRGGGGATEAYADGASEGFAAGDVAAASRPSSVKAAPGAPSYHDARRLDDVVRPPTRQSGPGLRAGSVDDNAAFADYLKYRDEFRRLGITVHDIDVSVRHVVTVVDEAGQPLLGATVKAGDQEVRTGADGRALLFGDVGGVDVRWGDTAVHADFAQDKTAAGSTGSASPSAAPRAGPSSTCCSSSTPPARWATRSTG